MSKVDGKCEREKAKVGDPCIKSTINIPHVQSNIRRKTIKICVKMRQSHSNVHLIETLFCWFNCAITNCYNQ